LVGGSDRSAADEARQARHRAAAGDKYMIRAYRASGFGTLSKVLWVQGFPEQAVRAGQDALDEARALDNPMMLCSALGHAACPIAVANGDLDAADRLVTHLLDSSTKNSLPAWNAQGLCLKGELLLARGDSAGLPLLQSSVDCLRDAKFAFLYVIHLGALAQGLGVAGRTAEARLVIDEALEWSDRKEERRCMAELLRIKGELLRLNGSSGADGMPEDCFLQVLDWARRQEALSWELRVAISLARLWCEQNRIAEARGLLLAVHDRFTEGFDTADLRTARALIGELS
jgi:hypothetical protein